MEMLLIFQKEKNIGRKPVLKDIVVGYLNGYHVGN